MAFGSRFIVRVATRSSQLEESWRRRSRAQRLYVQRIEDGGEGEGAASRRRREQEERRVQDAVAFERELALAAQVWEPSWTDGVDVCIAPLWRLLGHDRAWQRHVYGRWVQLTNGKADWSETAMKLWPERVVPKCADDRSLAIAHDLEDVFWEQDADGKWSARKEPTRPIDELVAERTSPAVKDALESLLSAPPAVDSREARSRKGRCVNELHEYLCQQLGEKLDERRVVVFYDPRSEFAPFFDRELHERRRRPRRAVRRVSSASGRRSSRATTGRSSRCAPQSSRSSRSDAPEPLLDLRPG